MECFIFAAQLWWSRLSLQSLLKGNNNLRPIIGWQRREWAGLRWVGVLFVVFNMRTRFNGNSSICFGFLFVGILRSHIVTLLTPVGYFAVLSLSVQWLSPSLQDATCRDSIWIQWQHVSYSAKWLTLYVAVN